VSSSNLTKVWLLRTDRNDPSARGISKLELVNLKLTARNASRTHDAGATVEPDTDISHHYRVRAQNPSC
jgi:hypothetical protein